MALFASGAVYGSGNVIVDALITLSFLLFLGAIINLIQFRRHRYSIQDLLKEHEKQLEGASQDWETPDEGWLYCPNCGEDYDSRFHVCPRCNRSG